VVRTIQDVFEAIGAKCRGRVSDEELQELENVPCPGARACSGQFTSTCNTNSCFYFFGQFTEIVIAGHSLNPRIGNYAYKRLGEVLILETHSLEERSCAGPIATFGYDPTWILAADCHWAAPLTVLSGFSGSDAAFEGLPEKHALGRINFPFKPHSSYIIYYSKNYREVEVLKGPGYFCLHRSIRH
jgi:hypothetical protein